MKKFFLFVLLGFFTIVIVLLIRTFTFNTKQIKTEQQKRLVLDDSCIVHLQKAIRFKTVSYDDAMKFDSLEFIGFQKFLKKTYPLVFTQMNLETVNRFSIILHWKGKNSNIKPIILMAHQDVVPIEQATINKWTVPPFSGSLKNGFVYGRGTIDDKGSLIAILESAEILLHEKFIPATDVYFVFGHDEEVSGLKGAKSVAKLFKKRNIHPEFVLDEGGIITYDKIPGLEKPAAVVGISEKGYQTIDLQINIPGGHSSMPAEKTALDEMAKAVVKLKQNPFKPEMGYALNSFLNYVGPELPFSSKLAMANRELFKPLIFNIYSKTATGNAVIRTTSATTIFNSGMKENAIPGQANATVNFRTQPGTSLKDVIDHVRKAIDNDQIKIIARKTGSSASQIADVDSPSFKYIQKTLSGFDPKLVVAPYLVLGATDGRYFGNLTPQVFRFIPFPDPEGFHAVNERIRTDDFKKGISFYYQLIKNYKK
ncbi:MAG: M20/M25/M40 family metallo-hydrolase [Daejeonella sp.]